MTANGFDNKKDKVCLFRTTEKNFGRVVLNEEVPQILCSRGKPVAALIDIESFNAFRRFEAEVKRPSMASLLAELDGINEEEDDFGRLRSGWTVHKMIGSTDASFLPLRHQRN
jgi:hypothetical protein